MPKESSATDSGLSWKTILQHWDLIEMDFHDHLTVDLGDETYWDRRTWAWMRLRILALITAETRLSHALRIQPL